MTTNLQIDILVSDETAPLEAVILGTARDLGTPFLNYVHPDKWPDEFAPPEDSITDPKSREHLMAGTYPIEADLRRENDHFARILTKHNVKVYQPITLPSTNQVFTRDIGFVIDNVFIKSNMGTIERQSEFFAIRDIVSLISQEVWFPPNEVKVEGGDVLIAKEKIYVGQPAKGCENMRCNRTNAEAINYLQKKFPHREIVPVPLYKSDKHAKQNCLHLDCAFQPIGGGQSCIIFVDGFENKQQAQQLMADFGGEKNAIKISADQMYHMNSNVFSISPEVVVTGNNEKEFGELNAQLESKGYKLEKIPYSETAKMEGLLRCSTLPLRRRYG